MSPLFNLPSSVCAESICSLFSGESAMSDRRANEISHLILDLNLSVFFVCVCVFLLRGKSFNKRLNILCENSLTRESINTPRECYGHLIYTHTHTHTHTRTHWVIQLHMFSHTPDSSITGQLCPIAAYN